MWDVYDWLLFAARGVFEVCKWVRVVFEYRILGDSENFKIFRKIEGCWEKITNSKFLRKNLSKKLKISPWFCTTECEVCLDGYYQDLIDCIQCPQNALYCTKTNGRCVDVSVVYRERDPSSCQTFVNSNTCASCFDGYKLLNGLCVKVVCKSGEYSNPGNNNICTSCPANSLSCVYNTTLSLLVIQTC